MKLVKQNNGWLPSIFDEFFTENRLDVPNYENFSIPAVNIQENMSNFIIELAVPGYKKEQFNIEVEDEVLKVSGEVSTEVDNTDQEGQSRFTRREFGYRNFLRTFNLPDTVNTADVSAAYEDGVLKINLPKKEEHKKLKRMVEIS